MTTKTQLPETTLDWFKTNAFIELSKMQHTPSVQIALRQHLRLTYWLSKCQPITKEAVTRACKAIAFADTPDGEIPRLMGQEHVDAVLCSDQGFTAIIKPETGEHQGWAIPEMLGMLEHANDVFSAGAQARAEKAKKAAEARWGNKAPAAHGSAVPVEPEAPVRESAVFSGTDFLAMANDPEDF